MSAATAKSPRPSPWDASPIVEGPSFAPPRTALEQAKVVAYAREDHAQRRVEARREQVAAQHNYAEAVRIAEVQQLRRRLARIREQRDASQPLMRDAVIGAAGVTTPLVVMAGSSGIRKDLRAALSLGAAFMGVIAGREWMQHQHDTRVSRLEQEAERIESRLAVQGIPNPPPSTPWGW
jgi:hypothetical protein